MDALRQDLRFALRLLLKSPGFTAVAVLSMALGIGVNVTVFGILHGLLLRPFPYVEPERVVALSTEHPLVKGYGAWSFLDYVDLQNENTVFQGVAAHRGGGSMTLAGPRGPEQIAIDAVSADLFPLLGVSPALGRGFTPMEDRPGGPPVVLLGHGLWQRRFGGDPGIVGSEVIAGGKPHRVIGVMPPGFEYPDIREAWVPLGSRWARGPRSNRNLQIKARLRPGVSPQAAQAELSTLMRRLEEMHPETNAGWHASVETLRQKLVPPRARPPFFILAGAAGCVLLLACVNVSSLLLAQAGGRQKELAIRAALGCSRGRIVRQLLTENLLLALAGGALGVLLSPLGLRAANRALAPIPFWMRFTLDGPVLLFALAASVLCGLIFGLVPALQARRIELRSIFKDGFVARRRRQGHRLRAVLVVGEVGIALILLIGTSLFLRSFLHLRNGDPRLASPHLLTLWTTLQGDAYDDVRSRAQKAEDIARRLAAVPGIDAVAVGSVPLYDTGTRGRIALAGGTLAAGKEHVPLTSGVTAGWFRAVQVPLLRGRAFTDRESAGGAAVAVVNQAFARRFFPGGTAVGRRLRLLDQEGAGWMTIVGVSGDLATDPRKPAEPQIYVPPVYQQIRAIGIVIRTRSRTQGAREGIVEKVRKELRASDPALPLFDVHTMDEVVGQFLVVERAVSEGFAIFGAIALFLAAIGIHGVLSCSVSQRVHELGVRIALGARRRHMVGLVLVRGLAMALAGIGLGLAVALAATRLVAGELHGVSATDPASFLAIPLLLLGVALAACWAPVRRAMDADPIEAIRRK